MADSPIQPSPFNQSDQSDPADPFSEGDPTAATDPTAPGETAIGADAAANEPSSDGDEEDEPLSLGVKIGIGVCVVSVALAVIAGCIQAFGNVYIGPEVLVLRLMGLPAIILLLLLLLVCSVGSTIYGIISLVSSRARSSWLLTFFMLIEGLCMTWAVFAVFLPWSVFAPIRDIPYLAEPLTGTVFVTGVNEETSTDSDGTDTTYYHLYCVPDDMPGYDTRHVFEFETSFENYSQWKSMFGEADSNSIYFGGYSSADDEALAGKPVYRVEILPNTSTLVSFEPVK